MIRLSLLRPLDQPPGTRRLLHDLKAALQDDRFNRFRTIVAYAKTGPLYRLQSLLQQWRESSKTAAAIFGIDQKGTSKEALELALLLFDEVYVSQQRGITFHPKIYLFDGEHYGWAFVGSNNLTVGGTEKNFEAGIHVELDLPDDQQQLSLFESAWTNLLPASCPATVRLDIQVLNDLVNRRAVLSEQELRSVNRGDGDAIAVGHQEQRSSIEILPESPLPRKVQGSNRFTTSQSSSSRMSVSTVTDPPSVRGFAIQIKPHHNGEVFLSVTAVKQNPTFFKWPFTGQTTPKRPNNPSYPQLTPDPVVNLTVFGSLPTPILIRTAYPLNTVYYQRRSEIRITASPLVDVVPPYSIMIIEHSQIHGIDYEMTVYCPDSVEFSHWVQACNQTMPGGGTTPRKYGWF